MRIISHDQRHELLHRIDVREIIAQAENLRSGIRCTALDIHSNEVTDLTHGTNVHIPLTFSDGVKWMARIRQNVGAPLPLGALRMHARSEVAIYKALKASGMPGPEVWIPSHFDHNDLVYFFIEFVEGDAPPFYNSRSRDEVTPEIAQAVYQYARWTLDLERVTFDTVGSPTLDENGQVVVGPVIDWSMFSDSAPFFIGPYQTARQRYIDHFAKIMQLILEGRWCHAKAEVQIYLTILEAKTLVEEDEEMAHDTGPFYLKHGEPKGDHVRMTPDGTITGVIDWDWSCITSKADAFAAPEMFLTGNRAERELNDLQPLEMVLAEAYERLDRIDLARLVRGGKKYQRLNQLTWGWNPAADDMIALRLACKGVWEGSKPDDMHEWMAWARERYRGNPGLEKLLRRKKDKIPRLVLVGSNYFVARVIKNPEEARQMREERRARKEAEQKAKSQDD